MHRHSIVAAACAAALLLAACGSDDDSTAGTTAGTTVAGTEASTAPITVTGAWARTSPMSAANGAAYMVITSATDDRLLSASLDPSVAEQVEIHETVMVEGGMTATTGGMTGDTAAPAMEMRPVEAIDLPAGTAVELKPGGYHVMIVGLTSPLEVGQELSMTLTFEQGGDLVVTVPVRDDAP